MKFKTLKKWACFAGFAALAAQAVPAFGAGYDDFDPLPNGEVALFGGGKFLDSNDWSPADSHFEFGGEAYYKPKPWPFGLTAGYQYSRGNGDVTVVGFNQDGFLTAQSFDVAVSTQEARFGLKKVWHAPRESQVYLEGGALYGSAKATAAGVSNSDHSFGGWVGGGAMYPFAYHWAVGPRVDYSYYKVNIDDDNANAGGFHIGLLLAYQW